MSFTQEHILRLIKFCLFAFMAAIAALVIWYLYEYYVYEPQTRDGKVGADVVALAADDSGIIDHVYVKDNEKVTKGQLLFTIDTARLKSAADQAEAAVERALATVNAAKRDVKRYKALDVNVSREALDDKETALEQAQADYQQALANRELARINLQKSKVTSPVNGYITNFSLHPGSYASTGTPLVSIVDSDSFYVTGYFEETKLPNIHKGMPATIQLMGESQDIKGHVASIAAGVQDSQRASSSSTLLANVTSTFSWVRLAQRIPVRVALDSVPSAVHLIAGRTATIELSKN